MFIEAVVCFFVMVLLNAFPWYLVFSKSARHEMARTGWWSSSMNEEERESAVLGFGNSFVRRSVVEWHNRSWNSWGAG
jgi:hypothetical protein